MDLQKHQQAAHVEGLLPTQELSPRHEDFFGRLGRHCLAPVRRFDPDEREWVEQPDLDKALLREELQTLENCNRRLGGHDLALTYVKRLAESDRPASLSVLDLGTGSADIPRAIAAWGRQRQCPVTITAVDGNAEVLQVAREACRDWPEIRLEQHDMRALPYPAESFDLVMCSLALHHFDSAEAVAVLRSAQRLARRGYVVNDLCRHWVAVGATELLVRVLVRSRVFRHDALQSCRAAFTIWELRDMARRAGLNHFQIKRHHAGFRMVLEGRK